MNILSILSSQKYVSGQEIARKLGVSRAAVHKHINKLRKYGYKISAQQNFGYTLISKPNLLIPEEIEFHLTNTRLLHPAIGGIRNDKTSVIARSKAAKQSDLGDKSFISGIVYYKKTVSTQVIAKELAFKGRQEGTLVICEEQAGGYGRLQRRWHAPLGGLWFSLLLRPEMSPDKAPHITLAMSVAICRVLKKVYNLNPRIKWPNDILLDKKKVCGILTEMSAEIGRVNWVVAGVGLNVNNKIADKLKNTAVALREKLGHDLKKAVLLSEIITEFSAVYGDLCAKGFSVLSNEYNGYSLLLNKKVKVNLGDKIISGRVHSIDPDGYLWIVNKNGKKEKIISGDII